MILDDINAEITEKTGIPGELLTCATPEENIAKARKILEYRESCEAERPKTTRELFAECIEGPMSHQPSQAAVDLAAIESRLGLDTSTSYPAIKDHSGPLNLGDPRTPQQQLGDYVYSKLAYDPTRAGRSFV